MLSGHAPTGGTEQLAGAEGFEPSVTDPKSVALPLGHAPLSAAGLTALYMSTAADSEEGLNRQPGAHVVDSQGP
jgi:hypothetical protein